MGEPTTCVQCLFDVLWHRYVYNLGKLNFPLKLHTNYISYKSNSYCFFCFCCRLLFIGRLCGRFWLYNRRLRWLNFRHFGGSVGLGEANKCFWAIASVPGYSIVGGASVCWHIVRYDGIVFARIHFGRRNHYNKWSYLICHSTNATALRCKKISRWKSG